MNNNGVHVVPTHSSWVNGFLITLTIFCKMHYNILKKGRYQCLFWSTPLYIFSLLYRELVNNFLIKPTHIILLIKYVDTFLFILIEKFFIIKFCKEVDFWEDYDQDLRMKFFRSIRPLRITLQYVLFISLTPRARTRSSAAPFIQ